MSSAADLAQVLEQLASRGVLGRATSLKVGDVEVQMSPEPIKRPTMSDVAPDDDEELMFASSGG